MFTWIIAFVVIGGLVGYFMTGSSNVAAEGASTGFAVIFGIIVKIILPIVIIIFLFRGCFG